MNNRVKGSVYEEQAASFFVSEGYTVLERNYKRKTGEIDLILRDPEGILVFAEVKYRGKARTGFPEEAVTAWKMQRIYRTAEWYLKEHGLPFETPCRFDVVSVLGRSYTHIPNAFGGF